MTLNDGSAANLGDTHTAFSPDFIFNNILTFTYAGFNASVQSQYIGKQYLTNTDFDSYKNYNKDGSFDRNVDMFLKSISPPTRPELPLRPAPLRHQGRRHWHHPIQHLRHKV